MAWGDVLCFAMLVFQARADFSPQWITRDVCAKETYKLHEALHASCIVFPGRLSRAQVIADVNNSAAVHNVRKGQARVVAVHSLLHALGYD